MKWAPGALGKTLRFSDELLGQITLGRKWSLEIEVLFRGNRIYLSLKLKEKNKCPLVGGSFYRRQSTVILEGLPHPPVSCPTLCDPVVCSPPGSSVHGILQARILEWVAMSFSRVSSWPRDQTHVSYIAGRFFTIWVTREAHKEVPKVRLGTFSRDLTAHCTTSQPGRSSGRDVSAGFQSWLCNPLGLRPWSCSLALPSPFLFHIYKC